MALIGYCIVDTTQTALKSIAGIEGKTPETVAYEDIAMVVSEVEASARALKNQVQQNGQASRNGDHGEADLQHPALRYDAVISAHMEDDTVLPLRFPTMLEDEASVKSILRSHYDTFRDQLNDLQGRVEYGIKIMWDGDGRREEIIRDAKKNSYVDHAVLSGKSFLQKRFALYKRDQQFRNEGLTLVEDIHTYILDLVEDLNYQTLLSNNYLLNGSYLLPRSGLDTFKLRTEQMEHDYPELKFIFSGPWAPFHFTELELNV